MQAAWCSLPGGQIPKLIPPHTSAITTLVVRPKKRSGSEASMSMGPSADRRCTSRAAETSSSVHGRQGHTATAQHGKQATNTQLAGEHEGSLTPSCRVREVLLT